MGSVDLPPFLREKQKQQVQQKQTTESGGSLPPFLKKKEETTSNDFGNGLNQSSPLPSQLPSENKPDFNKTAQDVLTNAIETQDAVPDVTKPPAQSTTPIDFNALNAQKGGSVKPTTEQKDLLAYGTEISKEQIAQRDESIDNTLQRKYKNLGISVDKNSPQYRKDFEEKKKELDANEIVLTKDKFGNRTTTRGAGLMESIGIALKSSFKAPVEAAKLEMLDGKDLADYLDKKEATSPEIEPSKPSGFGGAVGEMIGGFPKIGGLMAINEAVPYLGTALATAEAELSSTGQHIEQLYHLRLKQLTDSGVPLEQARVQAATEAKKDAPLAAAPDAAMMAALGQMGGDANALKDAAKTFKTTIAESTKSVAKMAALGGTSEVARTGIEKAQGYDVTVKDAMDNFGEGAYQWATMDAMFKIAPIVSKLPEAAQAAWKNYMSKVPAPIVGEVTSAMGEDGLKIQQTINAYKAADKSIPDNYSDEQRQTIAHLIQKKNELIKQGEGKDEAFNKDNELQISHLNNAIELAKNSKNPTSVHIDNVTGETVGNPKPFDELSKKERDGLIIPKDYGNVDVKEVGEGENKQFIPVATLTENKGAIELEHKIKDESGKKYADRKEAEEAAQKILAQHYYDNSLPDNLKPNAPKSRAKEPEIESAIIEINGKTYEGKNHAEAILKAKEDGQDISNVDRKAEGKFKLSDGTIIDRTEAKEKFGADRAEQLIPQDEAAKQADKDYEKAKVTEQTTPSTVSETKTEEESILGSQKNGQSFTKDEATNFHLNNKDAFNKMTTKARELGLIGENDNLGGVLREVSKESNSNADFSAGNLLFNKDGTITAIGAGESIIFDRDGNVVSHDVKTKGQKEVIDLNYQLQGAKDSVKSFEKRRDSEEFKYTDQVTYDPLGNKKTSKRLKTDAELKESTDKINAAIEKAKKQVDDLSSKIENHPDKNILTNEKATQAKEPIIKGVEGSDQSNEPSKVGENEKRIAEDVETTNHPEIKSLEKERDEKIKEISKPDLKLELISPKDLVKAKDPIEAKAQHDILKEKYKALRKLVDCI